MDFEIEIWDVDQLLLVDVDGRPGPLYLSRLTAACAFQHALK